MKKTTGTASTKVEHGYREVIGVIEMKKHKPPVTAEAKAPRWLVEERDACGVGFIAYEDGRKSHKIIQQALKALTCLEHRGGCCADGDSGDGSGVLTGLPLKLFQSWFAAEISPCRNRKLGGGDGIFAPR